MDYVGFSLKHNPRIDNLVQLNPQHNQNSVSTMPWIGLPGMGVPGPPRIPRWLRACLICLPAWEMWICRLLPGSSSMEFHAYNHTCRARARHLLNWVWLPSKTRKSSWCWHTRATQNDEKKFLHFEVI